MNDVMPQPMGERTPMTQSLRDRAQDAIMCCAALAWRIGGNVLFGMTTALALQQVPHADNALVLGEGRQVLLGLGAAVQAGTGDDGHDAGGESDRVDPAHLIDGLLLDGVGLHEDRGLLLDALDLDVEPAKLLATVAELVEILVSSTEREPAFSGRLHG